MQKILFFISSLLILGVLFFEFIYSQSYQGMVQVIENSDQFYVDAKGARRISMGDEPYNIVLQLMGSEERILFTSADMSWAGIRTGDCVRSQVQPYPIWRWAKKGQGHNGKLIEKLDCITLHP